MMHAESHSERAREAALAELSGGDAAEEICVECAGERQGWREDLRQLALTVPRLPPPGLRTRVIRARERRA